MNVRTKCLYLIAPLCLMIAAAMSLKAQAVYGNLIGTVTDPSGAVVAGAKVTARSVNQNISTTATTNDSGNYTMAQLPPGQYEITEEKAGFNSVVQKNVVVSVGQSARVDASLQVGAVTQQMVVSEA